MIEFGGVSYYIDIDRVTELIGSDTMLQERDMTETDIVETFQAGKKLIDKQVITKKYKKAREIDGTKYDLIKYFIEELSMQRDEMDNKLGKEILLEKMPIAFKIAFNTLYNYKILKEKN